eukprot:gnl/TRDRNA2_/TRDRNA2_148721_c0_seq2.p1 gnl/TRDRNA2_/TRDRNA2_148721_c0~~gnl/TRDRNA2_/TRDRNA2_148721_c0_seq2.p1  ORF type:complete len:105 (-),score=22.97 gnl/TRDRNA2_/TRDRNA2_148721_c0_seq2:59-373(-)
MSDASGDASISCFGTMGSMNSLFQKIMDRLLDNLLNFCPQTFKMALLEGIGAFSCCRPQQTAESYDGDAPVMPVHGDDSGLKIKPLPVLPPSDWKKGIEKAMGA